jgi:hypothetical protein
MTLLKGEISILAGTVETGVAAIILCGNMSSCWLRQGVSIEAKPSNCREEFDTGVYDE